METLVTRASVLDNIFRDVSPGFYVTPLYGDPLPEIGQIKIDVQENDYAYAVYAELPGACKENIHVSLEAGQVQLRADIKPHDDHTRYNKVLRCERYLGSVSRSFQLPQDVDRTKTRAKFENGVLTLIFMKRQEAGVQHLKIE